MDLGHAEACGVGGHPQVARGRQLQPGAQGDPVDAGDHRCREPVHRLAAAMHPGDEPASALDLETGHLADVGAAHEGAVAGAGQHQRMQGRVAGEGLQALDEALHQRAVQAVGPARVVDGDVGDAPAVGLGVEAHKDVRRVVAHGRDSG